MINSNSFIEINKKNLLYNYRKLSKIANKSITAATIKANAYGLGDREVFKILYNEGCYNFFLATYEEAINIRKVNKKVNLYVLNGLDNNKLNLFYKNNLIPILNTKEEFNILLKSKYIKNKFKFGIHIETGLNRLGINIEEIKNKLNKLENLHILISHLSSPDELKNQYTHLQNLNFIKSFNYFKNIKFKSLCSSSAIINNKDLHHDMVRPGISLYGGFNKKLFNNKSKVRPVITLKGKILQIKKICKNRYIGYNQTYKTIKNIKVAIIGIGYADGVSRSLSNKGKLFYKNDSYNIVGRVSMDSITVDITNSKYRMKIGQYMDVINRRHTIEDMAKNCGTISNEILTSISKRVKRVYI
jgi:alanine racemase